MEFIQAEDVFFTDFFNLEPKDIQNIQYERINGEAHFYLRLTQKNDSCPYCGHQHPKIKNYVHKMIKHSIFQDRNCVLHYRARRYICPICHHSYYEHNPFVFNKSKISIKTVFNCLDQLKNFNETFTSVARKNNISPTSVCSIFDQHVQISRKPLPEILNIDEVYAFRTRTSKYVCVLLNHETQVPVDILSDRKKDFLRTYFAAISKEEKKKVRIVCTDMYETYRSIIHEVFPGSIHAVDHYHVSQELHRKMNSLRIRIMKGYNKEDSGYYVLKKFNWLLFKNRNAADENGALFDINREKKYNHHYKEMMNYYDLRKKILEVDTFLKEAYELKNKFDIFYERNNIETASKGINPLIQMFLTSSIEEMNAFGRTLLHWKLEIINSFHIVKTEYHIDKDNGQVAIHEKRINNAIIENRNKVIKCIKNNANGYQNWERFRARVMYVLDPDQTYRLEPLKKERRKKDEHEK